MSDCSSPQSHQSSQSSADPQSPNTGITTPSIRGNSPYSPYSPSCELSAAAVQSTQQTASLVDGSTFSPDAYAYSPGTFEYSSPPPDPSIYGVHPGQQQPPQFYPPPPPAPRFEGYPPASAFYTTDPANPPRPATKVSPWEYQPGEEWVTADGRRVETSAMHLHCATM